MNRTENDVLHLNKLLVFRDFLLFSVQHTILISPRQFHLELGFGLHILPTFTELG